MFFAVSKISFAVESSSYTGRELHTLVEKIRARFRVCVMAYSDTSDATIAITSLALSEEALNKQIDQIIELCESSGFGRVASEATLLDSVDSIESEN